MSSHIRDMFDIRRDYVRKPEERAKNRKRKATKRVSKNI